MKRSTHRTLGWQTSCLRAFVVTFGFVLASAIVYAQESKPVGEDTKPAEATVDPTKPAPAKAGADSKMPDISGTWRNRKDPQSADIVIRRVEDGAGDFRFEDRPDQLIPSAPIRWSQEAQRFEQLMFDSKEFDWLLFDTKQTAPAKRTLQLSPDGKSMRVEITSDVLQKELGKSNDMSAELAEFLNQEWTRTGPPPATPAPMTASSSEGEESVDPRKPGRVSLEPATPLAKQIVELFAPRGAKVLNYEEGQRLHIEVPKDVAEDLGKLLELVAQERWNQAKPAAKAAAENSYAVDLEPATPLVKSLAELFGPRGAKVLEFQAGKRLKVEAPGDVFFDLEKLLRLVSNESQKQAELRRTLGLAHTDSAGQVSSTTSGEGFGSPFSGVMLGGGGQVSSTPFGGGFGAPKGLFESQGILAKETVDGLAFFSKPLGRWSHLRVPPSKSDGSLLQQTVFSQDLAVTRNDEAFFGFSSRTGRFAKLPIPKELRGKVFAHVSGNSAIVQLGDETYIMTAQSGEWSSPNSAAPANNAEFLTKPDTVGARSGHAILDTPAAKQLVEQLGAQESAAAAEAASIRQLQANGQAERNQQPIAEHQRKLKNLLSTAFDLKLQLEELQVKELQSRLSRLERQIGQRKELREKIIARRAAELIEGDVLRWDSRAMAPTKLSGHSDGDVKKPTTTATPAVVAILRERVDLLFNDLRSGKVKPEVVLRAINELAQAEPPEGHMRHVARLQTLVEMVKQRPVDAFSKAEVLEVEAAYEKARSSDPSPRLTASLTTKPPHEDERTFDGTPYSQWLKMLETERKPEKLAVAMRACARLAATGDERRIARGIFVAEKLFESTDYGMERFLVWDAGDAALKRLPGEAVIAELLAALHDSEFKDAREFQCRFVVSVAGNTRAAIPESLKAALKSHADELIATFLELARQSEDRNHRLLAGASSAWLISGRKLNEFDELRPVLMQALESAASRRDLNTDTWNECLRILVDREPEMPGLALLWVKYCEHQPRFALDQLGPLGHHGGPAVPHLLKLFLKIWKEREDSLRAWAAGDQSKKSEFTSRGDDSNAETRMVSILKVLEGIGLGARTAAPLLQQIASLAPATRGVRAVPVTDDFFDAVKQTLGKIGDAPVTDPKQPPPIEFSDFLRLQATWKLWATKPITNAKNIEFYFGEVIRIQGNRDGEIFTVNKEVLNLIGCRSIVLNYRIDEPSSPRQIDLWSYDNKSRKSSQLGIYELKGDRLKIELAKPGLPRPKEFSADPDKLPEGHVLLELERDF